MHPTLIRHHADSPYVRIDTLPEKEQAAFSAWIFRQTRPVVPDEINSDGRPAECAYVWDYARWLAEHKPAALRDPYST
jgi:hypothetical protein